MKNKMLIASILILSGCAGSSVDFNDARAIHVGDSSAHLRQVMGDPYRITAHEDYEVWIWSHANALTGKSSSVSFIVQNDKVLKAPSIPKSFD